ncbi:MAG TPA: DNA polymerase III subunit beta [Candidatus Paceibacterota bacterium]|nr:DNA polymerase III subunit beta [Candidatus Paceibacterota bacterium]
MTISIDKKILGDAVALVARFAERKVLSLPVLAGIVLVAEKGTIHLRATNLETSVDLVVEGEAKEAGTVALPASVLRDITSSFSGTGTVTLSQSGDTISVASGKAKSTIKTLPHEDFPAFSAPDNAKTTFTISGAVLRSLITSVAAYASPSTVRPELASVLLSAEGGTVKAVATDSFRLAEKKVSVSGSVQPFSILIPAKNALDIVQVLPDTELSVSADEHQCAFSWEQGTVMTRLVAIAYPDYAQIIPKSFGAEATILKKDLEQGLKRVSVFSDTFQKVRLGFDTEGKGVSLSARNADIGESSETLPASVTGDTIELSFNHRYLQAPLSSISTESITLQAAGIGRPLVIRGAGDASYLYLVMPMNQ